MNKYAEETIKMYEQEMVTVIPQNSPGFVKEFCLKNKGETIQQDLYRSLVGKLLYYVVKIGLECANTVRELIQHLVDPGDQHWRAMKSLLGI